MQPLDPIAEHWPRLERLLDEALSVPMMSREAWLQSLRDEDTALIGPLRALLRTQARLDTDDFLQTLPPIPTEGVVTEPREGDRIGPYQLLRELGRGGMGLVWLAERHDGMASRPVALKLPRLAWGQALAERLARERDILASLEHPHIARLYDAGIDAQGRPYIAMQYVEGLPIDQYAQAHALSIPDRIALLLQALSAVAHAHARLVVHRDLKPGNVLVDAQGQVALLDFGVAKLLEDGQTQVTALTELVGRAFTPDYASPEQIRGAPLGTGSDVYSLGVLAFELLSGARPYRLQRGSAAELEEAIIQTDAPRASEMAVTPARRKTLRGDLDAILGRALKKQVEDRYPTAEAFAQDLQRYLDGEPVQARPDGAAYRFAKFVRRHRLAVGMGTALSLAVVGGTGVSLWQADQARAHERRATAELRRQHAMQDLYIETLMRLSVMASDEPDSLTKPGAISDVLMERLKEFEQRFAGNPEALGAQLESAMLQLSYNNEQARALAVGEQLLQHQLRHAAPVDDVLNTYATLGRILFKLGRLEEAEAIRRQGLAHAPDVHDAESDAIRLTLATDLGDVLLSRGRRAEALEVLTRADQWAAQAPAGSRGRHSTLMSLGLFHFGFDDVKSLAFMQQADAVARDQSDLEPTDRASVDYLVGEALQANGRLPEAVRRFEQSMTIYRRESGRDSGAAIRSFGLWVGAVAVADPAHALRLIDEEERWLSQRPEGLKPAAQRSMEARRLLTLWLSGDLPAAMQQADRDFAPLLQGRVGTETKLLVRLGATTWLQAGRPERALSIIQPLHALQQADGGVTVGTIKTALILAEAQLAMHQIPQARTTLSKTLQEMASAGGERSRLFRQLLGMAAVAAAQGGDTTAAAALLARLERQPMPPFPSGIEQADTELWHARALEALGRAADAAALARQLLPVLQHQQPTSPRLSQARTLAALGT